MTARRRRKTPKRQRGQWYIVFEFWELESPAFAHLSADATRVYLFMRKRLSFDASNNGFVPFSHRDAATALRSSWRRASNALAELQHYGFVVCRAVGLPGPNIRPASEWQLTAFPCGGQEASRQFMRWDGTAFEPPKRSQLGGETQRSRAAKKQPPIGNTTTPRRQHDDAPLRLAASNDAKKT
jgi:hypothetical protein